MTAAAKQSGCDYGKGTRSTMFKLFTAAILLFTGGMALAGFAVKAGAATGTVADEVRLGAAVREERWKQLDPRLERIEEKIDQLLDRRVAAKQ